jgi:ribonuclease H2 subunit A
LTEKDREKIFDKINQNNDFCGYATKVLSPNTISNSMLRKVKYNLNELSHDTAISLIDKLYNDTKLNIVQVYLDTVGDPNKYEQKLSKIFPKLKIKVSKKADSLYPCVSAASICAKVTRDYCITHWSCSENMTISNYGSGKYIKWNNKTHFVI